MSAQDMLVVLCWWEANGVSEKGLFSSTRLRPHLENKVITKKANLVLCRPPRCFLTRMWLPTLMSSEKDFPCLGLVSPNIVHYFSEMTATRQFCQT